jgi:thiamine-phosphate diphosphorylase
LTTVPRLYVITPPEGDPVAAVEAALRALPPGFAAVQLRQPRPARELLALARELGDLCARYHSQLFVNDRCDVALAAGCGVHLPERGVSVADARALGVRAVALSIHGIRQLEGADFAVFAPVFDTPGKTARGLDALREVCASTKTPVLALGGIDERNARSCLDAGAAGVACIRSVLGALDVASAARRMLQALQTA